MNFIYVFEKLKDKVIKEKITAVLLTIIVSNTAFGLKPEKEYWRRPENYALIYKEILITTDDNYKIKTWFFPAQDSVPGDTIKSYYKNPRKREYSLIDTLPRPTIIICDGDAGNMIGSLRYVRGFATRGYNVVLFDWRGFGESSPFEINTDYLFYNEFLIDYEAVIDFVNNMTEVKKNSIGLFGYSTGAYFSFAVAFNNPLVKCVIGRGFMTNFDDFIKFRYKMNPTKKDTILLPESFPEKLCPINIAKKYDKPTMLIVGSEDERTPVHMSKAIFDDLKVEKELWIVDGAGHGGRKSPESIAYYEFYSKTVDFFAKYIQ